MQSPVLEPLQAGRSLHGRSLSSREAQQRDIGLNCQQPALLRDEQGLQKGCTSLAGMGKSAHPANGKLFAGS